MEPIKSIAVPATRRRTTGKPRRAGHPEAPADSRVNGTVGAPRRVAGPAAPAREHRYQIGQRLSLSGGGNRWARVQALCSVVALLPHEGGPFLYRVRSEVENYERIVAEIDLTPVT